MGFFTAKVKEKPACEIRAEEVYAAIAELPQFVRVGPVGVSSYKDIPSSGQLNMLNGCLVSVVAGGLELTWQLGEYLAPAHSAHLSDIEAINKFLVLMKRQATV